MFTYPHAKRQSSYTHMHTHPNVKSWLEFIFGMSGRFT